MAKKENPWLTHVKKTMKENPKMEFKDVLKLAKKTYKKVGGDRENRNNDNNNDNQDGGKKKRRAKKRSTKKRTTRK
jgi:hypothetical protein